MLKIAQSGAQSIKVISDDTDVFVLLMHFCSEHKLCCRLIMEATSSERVNIQVDIQASVKNSVNTVPHLLAARGLTGLLT